MKTLLTCLSALFITHLSWACGADLYYEEDEFYPIFNQALSLSPKYSDFLYSTYDYYNLDEQSGESRYQGNLDLWTQTFPNWSVEEINELLFGQISSKLKRKHTTATDASIFEYVNFARNSEFIPNHINAPWKYDSYVNSEQLSYDDKIRLGIEKFKSETNSALKQRYGYQVVKLMRYNRDYKAAIYFFEQENLNAFSHNEIFYYTLDQLAGCYYNLAQYNEAFNSFIRVFTNSKDRRNSAYLSAMFCINHTNPKSNLESNDDILNFYFLTSMSDFNDPIPVLKAMKAIDHKDERLKVIFARNMSYLDRIVWSKGGSNVPNTDYSTQDLKTFAQTMTTTNSDSFWVYAYYYLLGVEGEFSKAISGLKTITNEAFLEDRANLIFLFEAMQWTSVSDIDQTYFKNGDHLNFRSYDDYGFGNHHYYNDYHEGYNHINDYIRDHILFDLFYEEKRYAEAYLLYNAIGGKIHEHELIDELMAFVHKPNKSNLEKGLVRQLGKNPVDVLNFEKGNLYLLNGEFNKAKETFPKSPRISSIKGLIFSNSVNVCYNCPETDMMTDSVYLASAFDFIPGQMNSKELAEVLSKLEDMSADKTNWKGILANYLLGNFHYNISNTGYYRGTLWGQSNCCHYRYFTTDNIANRRNKNGYRYQLKNYTSPTNYSTEYKAEAYYDNVLTYSNNIELKARTTFLLAQCNQIKSTDDYYDLYYDWDGEKYFEESSSRYQDYFNELNSTYKNTKFHDMIIKECSYFRAYVQ